MANETPKTVRVEALEYHTYNGKAYQVGDTYDIDEQFADSVQTQGKAVRVDRVAHAKALRTPAVVKPKPKARRAGKLVAAVKRAGKHRR